MLGEMRTWVIGIDEVGRGPIAGPIAVGAVALPHEHNTWAHWDGLRDSKKLSERQRQEWSERVRAEAIPHAISYISANIIDEQGIVYAAREAARMSIEDLGIAPHEAFVMLDKNLRVPHVWEQEEYVKGDERFPVIALASIVAKVARDARMCEEHARDERYGFDRHKGYGTKSHYEALRRFGPSGIHRKTFLG